MEYLKTDHQVDAKGLACPKPIVKTKKAMNNVNAGETIEILATDQGSKADIKAWAKSAGHQYLGTTVEDNVLKHYLRKTTEVEKEEMVFSRTIDNQELTKKLLDYDTDQDILIDVREQAEYIFGHIPQAISIPLGEIDNRKDELDQDKTIYVICRTGTRSGMAALKLTNNGFENVVNVKPGMSEWQGDLKSDI
ncbi:sulfurtransferase TusA family protein [Oceanobacillus sp. 1P07AA]|uniref:sulfurtransferase TusA family protein n=1 Tax=Oceanobacillus sp. 1P07AA TaxID=3132293 RepID=UPI0039A412A2